MRTTWIIGAAGCVVQSGLLWNPLPAKNRLKRRFLLTNISCFVVTLGSRYEEKPSSSHGNGLWEALFGVCFAKICIEQVLNFCEGVPATE